MATESSTIAVIRASRPSFRNPHDKVAFAVHSVFLAAGYALTSTGNAALSDPPFNGDDEVGIDGWNEFEDCYGFAYTKTEKGEKTRLLVKCLVAGDVLVVDVLRLDEEQKEPLNLQINVKDYVTDVTGSTSNYGNLYRNLKGLVDLVNSSILAASGSSSNSSARMEVTEPSSHQPAVAASVEPQPHSPLVYPPVPPDFSDVYPGPGAGIFPQRGRSSDGSMLVGPHDPRFGQIDRTDFGYPGGPMGIPPGTRYDPIGPPGVPGFEPNRFIRQPPRPGRGTHPDLEHFQNPDYI